MISPCPPEQRAGRKVASTSSYFLHGWTPWCQVQCLAAEWNALRVQRANPMRDGMVYLPRVKAKWQLSFSSSLFQKDISKPEIMNNQCFLPLKSNSELQNCQELSGLWKIIFLLHTSLQNQIQSPPPLHYHHFKALHTVYTTWSNIILLQNFLPKHYRTHYFLTYYSLLSDIITFFILGA